MTHLPLNEFNAVLIHPPFEEWGVYRTHMIPIWRIVDPDNCWIVIETFSDYVPASLQALEKWGFEYVRLNQNTARRDLRIYIWGKTGEAPELQPGLTPYSVLSKLDGNKILINTKVTHPHKKGWYSWHPLITQRKSQKRIDPFAYPFSPNYTEVNWEIVSIVDEIREKVRTYKNRHWEIAELVITLHQMGLNEVELQKILRSATGYSRFWLMVYIDLARRYPLAESRVNTYSDYFYDMRNIYREKRGYYGKGSTAVGEGSGSGASEGV